MNEEEDRDEKTVLFKFFSEIHKNKKNPNIVYSFDECFGRESPSFMPCVSFDILRCRID